jgi:hypothetical protein
LSRFEKTTRRASGPPVEIPMAIISVLAGLRSWVGGWAGAAAGVEDNLKWTLRSGDCGVWGAGLGAYSFGARTYLFWERR